MKKVGKLNLSLIIPCYNEAENIPLILRRCDEVLSQASNIEIVIVDNGSTDNTPAILDELLVHKPYIVKVRVELNQGYGYGILAGLRTSSAEIIGWTHADMQTDPADAIKGLALFEDSSTPTQLFVKGKRHGRPVLDILFTIGMAIFETFLLRRIMWDINAQPTMFHRNFFTTWDSPPDDFSLDLYAYYSAKKSGLKIKRFPVLFAERAYGASHWNISLIAKYKFIKRTLIYSFSLYRKMK